MVSEFDERSRRSKLGTIAMYIALGLIALAVATFLYWSASSQDVLEVKNSPVPVRTIRDHPTAGGVIILKTDFCKKVDTTGRGRISFVSPSREVFLPTFDENSKKRCETTEIPVLIPADLLPGKYKIRFRITYQVNPIKQVIEEFDSNEFEVDPK